MAYNDPAFLPRNTAIVLQAFQAREGAVLQELNGRVAELIKNVETIAAEQRSMASKMSSAQSKGKRCVDTVPWGV